MSRAEAKPSNPFVMPKDMNIHGWIIVWDWSHSDERYNNLTFTHKLLSDALTAGGFDQKLAREKLPRHAFANAARKLRKDRIIRQFDEDETDLVFQFTHEHRNGSGFEYEKETLLTLSKLTGKVYCDIPELSRQAEELVSQAMDRRTSGDVAYILKKLFSKNADLFPIRKAGGVYFVSVDHRDFLDQISKFLQALGTDLTRLPIAKGSSEGDKTVKESVALGLNVMIKDLYESIEGLDTSRPSTFDRRAEKIRQIKFKITNYSVYLESEKDRLLEELDKADTLLIEKISAMSAVDVVA